MNNSKKPMGPSHTHYQNSSPRSGETRPAHMQAGHAVPKHTHTQQSSHAASSPHQVPRVSQTPGAQVPSHGVNRASGMHSSNHTTHTAHGRHSAPAQSVSDRTQPTPDTHAVPQVVPDHRVAPAQPVAGRAQASQQPVAGRAQDPTRVAPAPVQGAAVGGFVPSATDYARGDASKYRHSTRGQRSKAGRFGAGRADAQRSYVGQTGNSQVVRPSTGRGGSGGGGRGGSGGGRGGAGRGGSGGGNAASRKQKLWTIVLIVSLALLLTCGGLLALMAHGYHSGTKTYDMVAQEAVVNIDENKGGLESMVIDWDNLAQKNSDIVAWVVIPGTDINYPIVQGIDDHEYLNQNFMREDSLMVHKGTIFLSEQNKPDFSDEANYFFGHNMNDETMFGPIMDMFDQSVFDERRTVYVLTPQMNYRCETFALRLVPSTELSIIQPHLQSGSGMKDYIAEQQSSADIVPSGDFDAHSVSKIFSFITCGDDYANTRAVLFAGAVEAAVPLEGGTVIADVGEDGVVDSKVDNG